MNNMVLGHYLPVDSFIHRLDPRLKILGLMAMLIAVFFDAGFIGYAIIAAFIVVLLMLAHIPLQMVIKAVKPMLFMVLILSIFNILFMRTGNLLFKIGPIAVYSDALRQTIYIAIRLVLIISTTTILTATTKPLDLTLGLERLMGPFRKIGFPSYEIAMMISIALRFIPTLIEETQRIMKAQESRGVDFAEGSLQEKIRAIVSLIIPLFISAFQKAEDLANAMESRNYNPEAKRTRYKQLKWALRDTISTVCLMLVLGSVIALSIIK